MGMVGTRTFGRVGNLSWEERRMKSNIPGGLKMERARVGVVVELSFSVWASHTESPRFDP